jgi:hypothetical protein
MAPTLPRRFRSRRARPRTAGARTEDELTLNLTTTEPDAEPTVALGRGPHSPDGASLPVGWPIAATLAGVLVAAVGWVLVVGFTVLGWLAVDADTASGPLSGALLVGTKVWVLANGAGLSLDGLHLTLVPWGAVALFGFVLARCTSFVAARSLQPDTAGADRADSAAGADRADSAAGADRADSAAGADQAESPRRTALGIAVLATVGYLAPLLVVALLLGSPAPDLRTLVALLALVGCALWGSCRALGVDPTRGWPDWLRPVPTAVLGTQLVLLAVGAAVLVTGLLAHLDRVGSLNNALGAGVTGGIALLVGQLAFAPNAMVWGGAYALGAGFGLGDGSVVAPSATQVGLLPGVPILGAVPSSGAGGTYQLLWLAAGVVAGLVAAWLVVRRRPAARFDETALIGGLAGVVGGVVFVGLAWATSGDLGVLRLTGLGPRLPELAVMAVSTLGLSGMIGGLVLGLLRSGATQDPDDIDVAGSGDELEDDPEATVQLVRREAMSGSR